MILEAYSGHVSTPPPWRRALTIHSPNSVISVRTDVFLTFSGFLSGPHLVPSPGALADLPGGSVRQPPAHLSHDVSAGPAVSTTVAHFYLIQVTGTLGEVSELGEQLAGGRFLLWG